MEKRTPPADMPEGKIKVYGRDKYEEGDLVMDEDEGRLYRAVKHDTGYTVRQYYSHSTSERGPGPGWDFRWPVLKEYGVSHPSELPDVPYQPLELEPVEDEK